MPATKQDFQRPLQLGRAFELASLVLSDHTPAIGDPYRELIYIQDVAQVHRSFRLGSGEFEGSRTHFHPTSCVFKANMAVWGTVARVFASSPFLAILLLFSSACRELSALRRAG